MLGSLIKGSHGRTHTLTGVKPRTVSSLCSKTSSKLGNDVQNIKGLSNNHTKALELSQGSAPKQLQNIKRSLLDKVGNLTPHLVVASGQMIYGVWYILGHLVLSGEGSSDPLGFAFFRELIATAALLGIARAIDGKQELKSRDDLYWILVVGLFAFGNIGGFLLALSMLPEFTVSCSQPAVPVICLLISVILGKDRFTPKSILGVGLSAVGAIAVTTASTGGAEVSLGDSGNYTVGLLALGVSVLSYASMYIFLPKLSDKYPPLTTTAWYYSVCSVFTFFVVMQRLDFSVPSLLDQASMITDPTVFLVLLYASLFATVFTYGSVSYASQKLSPSQLSLYNTLQPFCVAAIAVVFMGKVLTAQELVGCLSIIVGLFTCQSAKTDAIADGSQSDESLFQPVFLGTPFYRGWRFHARKLMTSTYDQSIDLEEKDWESQREMTRELVVQLQRIDLNFMPWLVTMLGLHGRQTMRSGERPLRVADLNKEFLGKVRQEAAKLERRPSMRFRRGNWRPAKQQVSRISKRD